MSKNTIDDRFKMATGCDNEKHKNYRFCEYCEVLVPKARQALYQDLMDILKKYKSEMWSIRYKGLENEINQYFGRS